MYSMLAGQRVTQSDLVHVRRMDRSGAAGTNGRLSIDLEATLVSSSVPPTQEMTSGNSFVVGPAWRQKSCVPERARE